MLAAHVAAAAPLPWFTVLSETPGAWPQILGSIGLKARTASPDTRVFVLPAGTAGSAEWVGRVENGAILVVEGESSMAELFGFRRGKENIRAGSITDVHAPRLPIVWARAVEMPRFETPPGAQVFARERWTGAPMLAGLRRGAGAVLWVALPPGERGYERFPYLLHALADLGLEPAFRAARLWAFFDYSYRMRADVEYLAERWRQAGIAALHVASWHFFEPDAERDRYLQGLIQACHRRGVLVYAWLELPHVSEQFWNGHPEWREKTAVLQDAHLDWRKLMNLHNRDCFRAVAAGVGDLVRRFDWDGVNLAELYFESLEGVSNASRFTPMNDDVRERFRRERGWDPIEIFKSRADAASRRAFLDFRAELVRRMQEDWLAEVEQLRREKPHIDVVLTHVDDRFDSGMRDAIGADAARVLPLLDKRPFTFLIEDPATVWHLGPQRYEEIARRYAALTPRRERLAIDINIVERYQDVYPTKQQTGIELFQLVHLASAAFPRVALYFESSIAAADVPLLPAAGAVVSRVEKIGGRLAVESPFVVGVPWNGPALVDGVAWPVAGPSVVWLPAGAHTIEPAPRPAGGARVMDFNGDLLSARYQKGGVIELSYRSASRALAVLDRRAVRLSVDGLESGIELAGPATLILPRGQHLVTIETQ